MYALLTLVLISPTVVEWSPTPISIHSSYEACRAALDAKSGFKDRPTGNEWFEYNAMLKCEKI